MAVLAMSVGIVLALDGTFTSGGQDSWGYGIQV